MTPILASDFGGAGVAALIEKALWLALVISLLSLVAVLPPALKKKGRWHGWIALICSLLSFAASIYLLTTIRREWAGDDALFLAVLALPIILAVLSLFLSRSKMPNQPSEPMPLKRHGSS